MLFRCQNWFARKQLNPRHCNKWFLLGWWITSDWGYAARPILEKDEVIVRTFKGGLEFRRGGKAFSGILVLTNQNIIFSQKGKGTTFTTPFEDVNSAQRGKTRHKSVRISLKHTEDIRFFPSDGKDASVHELCLLIREQISAGKKPPVSTPVQGYLSIKEVIREKEVIVKTRCPYCKKLYDETENQCPNCSGSR